MSVHDVYPAVSGARADVRPRVVTGTGDLETQRNLQERDARLRAYAVNLIMGPITEAQLQVAAAGVFLIPHP